MGKNIENRKGLFKTLADYRTNSRDRKRNKELKENPVELEKGDVKALLLSSFLVIFIPTVLILGIIVVVSLLVFGIL